MALVEMDQVGMPETTVEVGRTGGGCGAGPQGSKDQHTPTCARLWYGPHNGRTEREPSGGAEDELEDCDAFMKWEDTVTPTSSAVRKLCQPRRAAQYI
jgi:hypothetical protein